MTSAVSICSSASLMLGGNPIQSFDENSTRARLCSNIYPTVRDYVLASHPWNVCIKRITLNPDTSAPEFDWAFQYSLPGDYIRLLQVGEIGAELDYMIEGQKLLCDSSPLPLRYVFRNDQEATWSPTLVMAVTMSMRQVLAYPITQSTSLEQLIDQVLEPILKKARAVDSQDQQPQTLGDFHLLTSRFSPRGLPNE